MINVLNEIWRESSIKSYSKQQFQDNVVIKILNVINVLALLR